jgi:hypothetical protein
LFYELRCADLFRARQPEISHEKGACPRRYPAARLAFWGSKTLSAVELGLFTELAKGPRAPTARPG